jgi:hypothetical protein
VEICILVYSAYFKYQVSGLSVIVARFLCLETHALLTSYVHI